MCEELHENKKRLEDIRKRDELGTYLHSIKGTTKDTELSEVSGIQRDFLLRVIGKTEAPKRYVEDKNAYSLCKFIADYEKKPVREVLDILKRNGLLPNEISPNLKMFEEDNQQEASEENDGIIENIGELTDCVKSIIENMHFRIKEQEWKFNSDLELQAIEVEKDSILLAGIETWESVRLAYLCADTADKDYKQIYENLRTHGKDKRILFLILCKDSHVYERAYEKIMMLKSENSILIINMEKSGEVYILSMHKKHRKAFEYEKEFASYKEEGERKGITFWSHKR